MTLELRGLAPLLQVFDMPIAVHFYRDLLGFEIVGSDQKTPDHFDWCLLRYQGVELMLNTAYESPDRPPTPDAARIEAHADTGLFFGCPDVDAAYRYLRERGLEIPPPVVQGYGMKQLYLTDPDGYVLCFQ